MNLSQNDMLAKSQLQLRQLAFFKKIQSIALNFNAKQDLSNYSEQ